MLPRMSNRSSGATTYGGDARKLSTTRKPVDDCTKDDAYATIINLCYLSYIHDRCFELTPRLKSASSKGQSIKSDLPTPELLHGSILVFARKNLDVLRKRTSPVVRQMALAYELNVPEKKQIESINIDKFYRLFVPKSTDLYPQDVDECTREFVDYVAYLLTLKPKYQQTYPQLCSYMSRAKVIFDGQPYLPLVPEIAYVFQRAESVVRRDVSKLRLHDSEYINDLQLMLSRLSIPGTAADGRQQQEVTELRQIINLRRLNSTGSSSSGSAKLNGNIGLSSSVFIPINRQQYYKAVLSAALEMDLELALDRVNLANLYLGVVATKKIKEIQKPSDILSPQSQSLLVEIGSKWQMHLLTRELMFVQLVKEYCLADKVDLGTMSLVLKSLKDVVAMHKADQSFTRQEQQLYQSILSELYEFAFGDMHNKLVSSDLFGPNGPNILPYILFMEVSLFRDDSFIQLGAPLPERLLDMHESLRIGAYKYFDRVAKEIKQTSTNPVTIIYVILTNIFKKMNTLNKRYTWPREYNYSAEDPALDLSPWIENLPITKEIGYQIFYNATCMAKVELKELNKSLANDQADTYTLEDIGKIHKQLVQLQIRAEEEEIIGINSWNIEDDLMNVVVDIMASQNRIAELVTNIINMEKFEQVSADNQYDSSVQDMMATFHALKKAVDDLNWHDEYHLAKFYTIQMSKIWHALQIYTTNLENKFALDLHQETANQPRSALRLGNGAGKKPEPFNFSKETCVKLNNVDFVKNEMNAFESEFNSAHLSDILTAHRANVISGYVLSIEGLVAENLPREYPMFRVEIYNMETTALIGSTSESCEGRISVWSDSFEYSTTQEKIMLGLKILGLPRHKTAGRVCAEVPYQLRLSTSKDFDPETVELSLGISSSTQQSRIRFTVTVERDRDDVAYYFGKTFKELEKLEKFMVRSIVDKLQVEIRSAISVDNVRRESGKARSFTQITKLFTTTSQSESIETESALEALLIYFAENFSTLSANLSGNMTMVVILAVWDSLLEALESLALPSKPRTEVLRKEDITVLNSWVERSLEFFHGEGKGPSRDVLRGHEKYRSILFALKYYGMSPEELARLHSRIAEATAQRVAQKNKAIGRQRTIRNHRNLSTMKSAANNENSMLELMSEENVIMRMLRMKDPLMATSAEEALRTKAMQRRQFNRVAHKPDYASLQSI
ncbi:uncharacterized protein V1518DRAFT_434459 [Limtongia smithiae]|uniref:uncharacterized protein n=1 Tax=Limtongia smithiae TaxID=1125753 RepID=UPI0034CEEA71